MRRLVLVLVVASLVSAAPAAAQDRGDPAVGGGSFNSAPILEPGRYHDTILPGEYLYYGVRLAAGQRLHVELTHPDIDNSTVRELGVIFLSGNIHFPTRTVRIGADEPGDKTSIGFGNDEQDPLVVTSPEAEAEEDTHTSGDWKGAGVYYLALHAVWSGGDDAKRPKAEIPFVFSAEVLGTAQANETPSPTPTPTPTRTATPSATPTAPPSDDGGPPAALAAVGGVVGILIGAAAGIARRRQ